MMCPVCAGNTTRVFEIDGYWIRACAACRHRFAELQDAPDHVQRVYADDYFFGGGAGYPDYLGEARILEAQGRRYARLMKRFTSPGTVLDVGAAAGFLLQGFLRGGWRGLGIEPNQRMCQHGRTRMPMENTTLERFTTTAQFDLVCMVQVVAHFVDVRRAFQAAAQLTRPGGWWLIETWDVTSLTARLLGKYWHEYSPPSVLHWFSPRSLQKLAGRFGLRQVARGRPRKRISGRHAKALLGHKLQGIPMGPSAAALLSILPDRLVLPYPSEDLTWTVFRKS